MITPARNAMYMARSEGLSAFLTLGEQDSFCTTAKLQKSYAGLSAAEPEGRFSRSPSKCCDSVVAALWYGQQIYTATNSPPSCMVLLPPKWSHNRHSPQAKRNLKRKLPTNPSVMLTTRHHKGRCAIIAASATSMKSSSDPDIRRAK